MKHFGLTCSRFPHNNQLRFEGFLFSLVEPGLLFNFSHRRTHAYTLAWTCPAQLRIPCIVARRCPLGRFGLRPRCSGAFQINGSIEYCASHIYAGFAGLKRIFSSQCPLHRRKPHTHHNMKHYNHQLELQPKKGHRL